MYIYTYIYIYIYNYVWNYIQTYNWTFICNSLSAAWLVDIWPSRIVASIKLLSVIFIDISPIQFNRFV